MKRKLVAVLLTALLILQIPIFVSCNKDPSATDISKIIAESVVNDEIVVRGVVYLTTSDGFYIADKSEGGRIFVSLAEHGVSVGDELIVQGKYQLQSNRPMVVEATLINKGSNKALNSEPTSKTIAQVRALSGESKGNYSEFVTIKGFILKDSSNRLTIRDYENLDQTLLISNPNADSVLLDYETLLVTINVALRTWTLTSSWTVDFGGTADDVTTHTVAAADVTTQLTTYINAQVPEKVYGALLQLPQEFPMIPGMSLTWTVPTNDAVAINAETGEVTVTAPTAETSVELTATAKIGTSQTTIKRTVKIQPVVVTSIGDTFELLESGAYKWSNALVAIKGRVVGKSRNQGGTSSKEPEATYRAIILWDSETNDNIVVEFRPADSAPYNFAFIKTVNVGDDVEVTGQFRTSMATRLVIEKTTKWETKATNQEVDYSKMGATELVTAADYAAVKGDEAGNGNKLFKLVNPFLTYSDGKTMEEAVNSNAWIPFGFAADGIVVPGSKQVAFLITTARENIGNDFWHSSLGLVKETPKQIQVTIYAYIVNFTSATYLPFSIPSIGAIQHTSAADQIKYEVASVMPEAISVPKGVSPTETVTTLTLPTTHAKADGALTWASDKPAVIDPTTGNVIAPEDDAEVKLTLTFAVASVAQSIEFIITVYAQKAPLTVSEALTKKDGALMDVQGIIIGFTNPNTGSDKNFRGIIISDGTNILFVHDSNISRVGLDAEGNETTTAEDIVWNYFVIGTGENRHILEIGDEILLKQASLTKSSSIQQRIAVNSADDGITVVDTDKQPTWGTITPDVVITNEAEARALFEAVPKTGMLIKFEGTEENPFFIVGSSASKYDEMYLRFHYTNKALTSGTDDGYKYGFGNYNSSNQGKGRYLAFSVKAGEHNFGQETGKMLTNFFGLTEINDGTGLAIGTPEEFKTINHFAFKGTLYAMTSYVPSNSANGSYYQLSFINLPGTSVTRTPTPPTT